MTRSVRILVAAGALVLLVVATALAAPLDRGRDRMSPVAASHQPSPGARSQTADRDDGPPSAEHLDRLVTLLGEAGVSTDAATIEALAARYGVGGAVRLLAWSEESGVSADALAAKFDSGMGWGEIAHELNAANGTSLHPGIGPIMGNAGGSGQGIGAGREHAPGQQKKAD
jgi:hypothetical protein